VRLRVLIACAVALAPLVLWAALPLRSQGASPAELQQKIDSARSQIQAKRGKERVLTTDVERWSSKINRLQGKIGSLQSRQASLESDLQAKQAELSRTQADLRSERARLARLRSRLVVARKALSTRLVEMYKADRPDALSVVLNSDGFADLLERGEFIKRISEQDRQVVTLVRDAKKDATATAKRLDALERRQQEITTAVLDRRNEVAAVKQDLIDTRVGFQQTREVKANALSKIRVSRQELESHVAGLEKEQARIQATLTGPAPAGAGPIKQGSGQLIWPANGAVSSSFGQRWGRLHAGIDIPLSVGTPLRAADGGRVAIAGWTGGYGNYTCIQHNGSLSTCYAHQSSIGVSVGQNVSQGQVIGMSGNTGNSTGPHLHFEVRINGSPVDPMGYL
jgi:murein DD-endopeptidase MepM/ murein hydrolase activator NlpD